MRPSDIVADLGIESCDMELWVKLDTLCRPPSPVEQNELKLLHYHCHFAAIIWSRWLFRLEQRSTVTILERSVSPPRRIKFGHRLLRKLA